MENNQLSVCAMVMPPEGEKTLVAPRRSYAECEKRALCPFIIAMQHGTLPYSPEEITRLYLSNVQ